METLRKYPLSVAIMLVIANMIGTGVFTSLGYQVGPLPSGFVILLLWLVGGVVACYCGWWVELWRYRVRLPMPKLPLH